MALQLLIIFNIALVTYKSGSSRGDRIQWYVLGQTAASGCKVSPTFHGLTPSPSAAPWRWGQSHSLQRRRTFGSWRVCLPENISFNCDLQCWRWNCLSIVVYLNTHSSLPYFWLTDFKPNMSSLSDRSYICYCLCCWISTLVQVSGGNSTTFHIFEWLG